MKTKLLEGASHTISDGDGDGWRWSRAEVEVGKKLGPPARVFPFPPIFSSFSSSSARCNAVFALHAFNSIPLVSRLGGLAMQVRLIWCFLFFAVHDDIIPPASEPLQLMLSEHMNATDLYLTTFVLILVSIAIAFFGHC